MLRPASIAMALIAAAALTACGTREDPTVLTSTRARPVPRALEPYVDEFQRLYGGSMPVIPMTFGPLEAGVAGKCYVPGAKSPSDQVADAVFGESTAAERRIVINQDYFARHQGDHERMQVVVFHELGHCLLNRGHSLKTMVKPKFGKIPFSIMYPETIGGQPFYQAYVAHYEKELIDGAREASEAQPLSGGADADDDAAPSASLSPCVEIDPEL